MSKKWSRFSKGIEVRYGGTPCKLGTVDAETGGSQFEPICTENLSQKQRGRGTYRRVQSKYPNIRQDKTPEKYKELPSCKLQTGRGSVCEGALETDEWMRLIRAGRANQRQWKVTVWAGNRDGKGITICGEQIRNWRHRVKTHQCNQILFPPPNPPLA